MTTTEKQANAAWAICMAREDSASLGSLRLISGIELGEDGTNLWLRGRQRDDRLESLLAGLPARERYDWLGPNRLRQSDRRIPSARLPDVHWQPLGDWLQVQVPAAALPGKAPAPISLRLVRSTQEQDPVLLLTTLDELRQFAALAARVRLDCLQFAATEEGLALVLGRPLPPLPGRRFVLNCGVAIPAGFSWEPAINAEVVSRSFGASGKSIVLWTEEGIIARLNSEQFVPATRGAIRATALAQSA
jgi:hypothetical protein